MNSKQRSDSTLGFYEENAQDFFDRTFDLDLSHLYSPFLERLPKGAHILDAGCGSGRDSKAFLDKGYRVTGMDATEAMVELSRRVTGLPIVHQSFQEMSWEEAFDGIWASATLLHVPKSEMPSVFRRFERALKPGGIWYLSFKHGDGEREKDGRHFSDYTDAGLLELLEGFPGLRAITTWQTPSVDPNRQEQIWLNGLLEKQG
ncbi:MAG: class I SAM-dependent methyltransferase [Trueperaceae bacterium]|nr:MAG: class I SAM-dependent methyltransferase [Trueperaceae bacterium]